MMQVAAIQLEVDPSSRTATLQRALRSLNAAAEMDPAPDLIVLPAFLDTCSDGRNSHFEFARGQGTAACGFQARNWGVFLAMGLAERGTPLPGLKSILFDRDGDDRLIQPLTRPEMALKEKFQSESGPLAVASVLLGRIALLVDDDILNDDAWDEVVSRRAQLIVGTIGGASSASKPFESALSALAKKFARPCVVADVTTGGGKGPVRREGVSRIVESSGRIVGAVGSGAAGIITARLKLPTVSASGDPVAVSDAGE